MTTDDATEGLDVSDLERWMGVPMEPGELKEPVAVNDIRRWVQGMHYPNPLHYDERWAAESRFGTIIAVRSRSRWLPTRATVLAPAQVGKIPGSHMLFGGDEWWFFGPNIYPGDHLVCHRMPYDYKVSNTSFAGPTCFQRGDTIYINQKGERVGQQRSTSIRYVVREAKEKKLFVEPGEKECAEDELLALEEIKGPSSRSGPPPRPAALRVGADRRQARPACWVHTARHPDHRVKRYPMTTWGAMGKGPTTVRAEELGYRRRSPDSKATAAERTNPSCRRRVLRPSRGHLQPKWARHGHGAGYGWAPRWARGCQLRRRVGRRVGVHHAPQPYRNPAFTGDATFIDREVIDTRTSGGARSSHVKVELRNQDGTIMARGEVDVELPVEAPGG
jgi:acyl dehydratase